MNEFATKKEALEKEKPETLFKIKDDQRIWIIKEKEYRAEAHMYCAYTMRNKFVLEKEDYMKLAYDCDLHSFQSRITQVVQDSYYDNYNKRSGTIQRFIAIGSVTDIDNKTWTAVGSSGFDNAPSGGYCAEIASNRAIARAILNALEITDTLTDVELPSEVINNNIDNKKEDIKEKNDDNDAQEKKSILPSQITAIKNLLKKHKKELSETLKKYKVGAIEDLTTEDAANIIISLNKEG